MVKCELIYDVTLVVKCTLNVTLHKLLCCKMSVTEWKLWVRTSGQRSALAVSVPLMHAQSHKMCEHVCASTGAGWGHTWLQTDPSGQAFSRQVPVDSET